MPSAPSPTQSATSRLNGARSTGPATAAGKACSALNSVRHGLCGRTFFLLVDEDPEEFAAHEFMWLAVWAPRDLHKREAATAAIRAMWREVRADRLEAVVLGDLFGADAIANEVERAAAKTTRRRQSGSWRATSRVGTAWSSSSTKQDRAATTCNASLQEWD